MKIWLNDHLFGIINEITLCHLIVKYDFWHEASYVPHSTCSAVLKFNFNRLLPVNQAWFMRELVEYISQDIELDLFG